MAFEGFNSLKTVEALWRKMRVKSLKGSELIKLRRNSSLQILWNRFWRDSFRGSESTT